MIRFNFIFISVKRIKFMHMYNVLYVVLYDADIGGYCISIWSLKICMTI